jgi:phospholipid/cholesterol/gamma-HCH transport system substrate-binding protein
VPAPTALPSGPSVPASPSAPSGGEDPLCPPVCTAGYGSGGHRTGADWPEGINLELAELMLKGVQP